MPEGPELFLTCQYINHVCSGLVFSGRVEKSQVSKNPDVPFESKEYLISATSRGKELKLTLTPVKQENSPLDKGEDGGTLGQEGSQEPMDLVFRFGMSGCFKLTLAAELPKHAHLRFYTKESPPRALCFVDFRRFGRWEVDGSWQPERGPCVMLEYEQFRSQIPPFEKARTVLESLQHRKQEPAPKLSKKVKIKQENPDLLELCHRVPMEVILIDGKGYDPDRSADSEAFEEWLRCYSVPGMKSLRDSNGRTIWFQGDPGPLAPKGGTPRKRRLQAKADPEVPSPKVTKSRARRNSKSGTHQGGAAGAREKKKGGKAARENAEHAGGTGTRNPNPRAKRKTQKSPAVDSTAVSQNTRASARRSTATAAAAPRSRQVKAE